MLLFFIISAEPETPITHFKTVQGNRRTSLLLFDLEPKLA